MIDLPKDASIVLLIDADNIGSSRELEPILKQLQAHQSLVLRRAYGDWFSGCLKGWQAVLTEYEIEPIHSLPTPESGKNATDIRLVIDAMDLLHDQDISCFYIVSSDRDFTPLVRRLKQSGKKVIGAGRKNSAPILRNAYHQFIDLDEVAASNIPVTSIPVTSIPISGQRMLKLVPEKNHDSVAIASAHQQTVSKPAKNELLEIAQAAYQRVVSSNGWITVEQLELLLREECKEKLNQGFSCKLFGCKGLLKLVDKAGCFEWDEQQPAGTKVKSRKLRLKKAA